jgi:hypothetical protein
MHWPRARMTFDIPHRTETGLHRRRPVYLDYTKSFGPPTLGELMKTTDCNLAMRALSQSLLSVRRNHGRSRGKVALVALAATSLFMLRALGCHRKRSASATAASASAAVSSASASAGLVVFSNGYRPRLPAYDDTHDGLNEWGPTSPGSRPTTGDGTKQPMHLGLKGSRPSFTPTGHIFRAPSRTTRRNSTSGRLHQSHTRQIALD